MSVAVVVARGQPTKDQRTNNRSRAVKRMPSVAKVKRLIEIFSGVMTVEPTLEPSQITEELVAVQFSDGCYLLPVNCVEGGHATDKAVIAEFRATGLHAGCFPSADAALGFLERLEESKPKRRLSESTKRQARDEAGKPLTRTQKMMIRDWSEYP